MLGTAKTIVKRVLPARYRGKRSIRTDVKATRFDASKFLTPKVSPVRVLFTSGSDAGSWKIRGEQIAACRTNWHAAHDVASVDLRRFDVVCIVKRHEGVPIPHIKRLGKLIAFDIVDSWAQPDDGVRCRDLASVTSLFAGKWTEINADGYIFPNQCMKQHLRKLVPFGTHIYHHYYPLLEPIPIRSSRLTIGYEGNESYLGPWHEILEEICRRKGLRFVVNPPQLSDIDIGIAARGGMHDSFLANRYKSNVKLANFYGAGIPCIVTAKDRSYQETDQGDVRFFHSPEQLEHQIEALLCPETRRRIQERFLAIRGQYHLSVIADTYDRFFQELVRRH